VHHETDSEAVHSCRKQVHVPHTKQNGVRDLRVENVRQSDIVTAEQVV